MNKFCFVQLYHISQRGGGAEVQSNYLAEELVTRGFEVHYICKSINHKESFKILNGINIHFIPNKDSIDKNNLKRIYALLIKINPDFIIERMSSAYGDIIVQAKKKINAKYVWICTDNESSLAYKTVKNYYNKLSLLKFILVLPKAFKKDRIRIKAIKNVDFAFSQNETQRTLLKKNFDLETQRMISGHPIPSKITSTKNRFEKREILWCANMGDHKRPKIFVELAKRMLDTDFKFIMVGSHSNKKKIKSIFKNHPENLVTTGQLSFNEALKYFDTASILVNTSIAEGFSNTYIQGWLRGVPSIVFGADPSDVIANNKLGYNVTGWEMAVDKIMFMLSDFSEYESVSNNVINYAKYNHTIAVMTENFLNGIKLLAD